MIIFTLRRLLLLLVTLFFLTFVGFSLSYFTPHAPLQGSSLWDAWLFWFNGVLHWDFGVSSINGQLISEQLKEVFPATMELCILAFGFALLVGIPVGMVAGITRNKWQDKLISALALVGFSVPVFWLALLFTLFFAPMSRARSTAARNSSTPQTRPSGLPGELIQTSFVPSGHSLGSSAATGVAPATRAPTS